MQMRPITDTIREIRGGALQDECDAALHQLIDDCLLAKKAGTLTLTIKLTPPKESSDIMHVTGEVKATKPVTPAQTLFFIDSHGNLVKRDPRQPELGLEDTKEAEQSGQVKEA